MLLKTLTKNVLYNQKYNQSISQSIIQVVCGRPQKRKCLYFSSRIKERLGCKDRGGGGGLNTKLTSSKVLFLQPRSQALSSGKERPMSELHGTWLPDSEC